jgi:hypothetical protein
MKAMDIAKAIQAMDQAAKFIRENVAANTPGKVDAYCDLEFSSMRFNAEMNHLDVKIQQPEVNT